MLFRSVAFVDSSRAATEARRVSAVSAKATPELPDESLLASEDGGHAPVPASDVESPPAEAAEIAQVISASLAIEKLDPVETLASAVEAQM